MKANEAPKKIYLQVCGDCPQADCESCKFEDFEDNITWCKDHIFPKDIEYTRTDAFIEKALRFFKTKFDVEDYYDKTINGDRVFSYNKLISDFKDYLQNESEMPKKP